MDNAIFDLFARVQGEEDEGRRAELRSETNPALVEYFGQHPHMLQEVAFEILNQVWADTMGEDLVPQLINVKTVGIQEIDYIEEDLRGGRAYWQGKGGQIRSFVMRYERERMPAEEMVAAIDLHQDEFRTDFWGGLDKLIAQAREKMRQLPTERLISLVQASVNAGLNGTQYGEFARATITDTQVDTIVRKVRQRSRGGVSLLGTDDAVSVLADIGAQFSPDIATEVFRTGRIGTYKGTNIVRVENFEDFDGSLVLPEDEILVVGQNAGRLTFYGDNAKVQQLPQPSFNFRWETGRDAGMLLYGADKGRIGRIKLT